MKTFTLLLLLGASSTFLVRSQVHINKEWGTETGTPKELEWSATTTIGTSDLIHVGNTLVANEGANILTTRFDNLGNIVWQDDYHSSGENHEMGVAVTIDQAENIYVLGVNEDDTTELSDILLLKYNSTGTLLWNTTFNASYDL